jgi:pilin isopeptide linkage protein
MKKFRVLLLTAVLAVAMMAGSLSVFAADEATIPDVNDDGTVPVTKTLKTNKGSTVTETFSYTIVKVATDTSTVAETPDATIAGIEISAPADATSTDGTSEMVFGTFPHAGVYQYTVTETKGNTEGMTYDGTVYTVRVFVVNGTDGLEIRQITAEKDGEKVDAVKFENSYVETASDLTISKVTTGDSADRTLPFKMTITLHDPTLVTQRTITTSTNVTDKGNGVYEVDLSNGQSATFSGMLAGTTYDIVETQDSKYTATAEIVANGETVTTQTPAKGDDYEQTGILIGENTNSATITNTMEDITITGVITNILPFVMMIAIGGAAAALYVVSRRRKMAR